MRILLSLLLALTVHAQVLDPKNYCPIIPMDAEYFVTNDTCYLLSGITDKKASWTFAHNDCKRTKGSLLIFKDKSNEDAVINQIAVSSGFDSHFYWLDINKVGGSWKWTTGATVTYTPNWETGNGNCAVINVATKTWSARDCIAEDWFVGYICQYEQKCVVKVLIVDITVDDVTTLQIFTTVAGAGNFKNTDSAPCSVQLLGTNGYLLQDSTSISSSSRVTQDAAILLTLVLTLYMIFVTDV